MAGKHTRTFYVKDGDFTIQRAQAFAEMNGISFSDLISRALYAYMNPRDQGARAIEKLHKIRALLNDE